MAFVSLTPPTGDSSLYNIYLEAIGAAMVDDQGHAISDAVSGVMAWCPITSLDYADAAYEWNMGQYVSSGTRADSTWTFALSEDLASAFAAYINQLGLVGADGAPLRLAKSEHGIYAAGSYYDYVLGVGQDSLNNFLQDTSFPYSQRSGTGGPAGMPMDAASGMAQASSTTYDTVQDYIAALNADEAWMDYDASSNTAKVASLEAFAKYQKTPSKSVPAFDGLQRGQAENDLFGNHTDDSLHFDPKVAELLQSNQSRYATFSDRDVSLVDDYTADLKKTDALDHGSSSGRTFTIRCTT